MSKNNAPHNNKPNINYAIIGDVHGMLAPLKHLLHTLGFRKRQGVYQHPNCIAIFVGDLVDRGKQQREVLELVRAMVEYGSAQAIMGNHEYNVIGFYSINPQTQQPFIPHTLHHLKQREAILKDYPLEGEDTAEMINWLKSLPLFIEHDDFRVIHATWSDTMIKQLSEYTNEQGQLYPHVWQEALTENTPLQSVIRVLLKGAAITPPDELKQQQHRIKLRYKYRISWWNNDVSSWQRILCSTRDAQIFSSVPLPEPCALKDTYGYNDQQPPLFIGHYWFKGTPKPLKKNIACLDYSACVGGKLTAYLWKHEDNPNKHGLRADRFISVPSHDYRQER